VRDLAAGLAGLGVDRGDTVALMLTNRPEFHLVDVAARHLGAVAFSVYNTSSPEQIEYLLGDAGNRVLVNRGGVLSIESRPRSRALPRPRARSWSSRRSTSCRRAEARASTSTAAWQAVSPDDLVTLIYTSGTTGPPKGVQLTHANVMAQWRAIHAVMPRPAGGAVVSYLPAAHVADRVITHYAALVYGTSSRIAPTQGGHRPPARRPADAVGRGSPDLGEAQGGARGGHGRRHRAAVDAAREGRATPADEQVLGRLRERLGLDAAEHHIVGAAPTPPDVLEFFSFLGMNVCELWGMSETCGVAT
jgi:long-subunit acyl-CoA synthetase (AMP-forming)